MSYKHAQTSYKNFSLMTYTISSLGIDAIQLHYQKYSSYKWSKITFLSPTNITRNVLQLKHVCTL